MENTQVFTIKLFTGPASLLPMGACWQAEDIDGNRARIWLAKIVNNKEVWRWHFEWWNGEVMENETNQLRRLLGDLSEMLVKDQNGNLPDFMRAANFYTGRKDTK